MCGPMLYISHADNYYLNLRDNTIMIKLPHAYQKSVDHKGLWVENVFNLENRTVQNQFEICQKTVV